MAINWDQVNQVVGSKGFENAAQLGGTFLSSLGSGQRQDKQNALSNQQFKAKLNQDSAQFAAKLAAELENARRGDNLSRAVAAMQATKLGENENFATRNRILREIIPNMRNSAIMPSDPGVAAAMPKLQGPLDPNGIPPEALAALSEAATGNAIANRSKQLANIDSRASMPNFQSMGFGEDMGNFGVADYVSQLQSGEAGEQNNFDQQIKRALMQDYEGIQKLPDQVEEEKKKGFLANLGRVLKVAAPIAAAFIPGIGPLASMAIAGAGSGAGSLMAGEGLKGALANGAMGAASGYGARKVMPGGGPPSQARNLSYLNFRG